MSASQSGRQLSESRERYLWRRFAADRDRAARDELVAAYMPVARRMAARYAGVSEPFDDLLQVASLALVNAVDRFDPSRGTPFMGFAKPTILGELKRHFRDKVWTVRVPRSVHDLLGRLDMSVEKLSRELRRPPTVVELSHELGVETSEVLEVLEARHVRSPLSLDAPTSPDDEDAAGAVRIGEEDPAYELVEDRLALTGALAGLDDLGRELLRLRFEEELPQTEIAARVGWSQMHVSRLLRRTMDEVREIAEGKIEGSGTADRGNTSGAI